MTLDFKVPKFENMIPFMLKQERFSALQLVDKQEANKLYQKTVNQARKRFLNYAKLSGDYDKFIEKEHKRNKESLNLTEEGKIKRDDTVANSFNELLKSLDF